MGDGVIRRMRDAAEADACARMMVSTDPWVTFGRSYERALAIFDDPLREVYVWDEDGAVQGFIVLVVQGAFVGYIQTVCVAPEARGRGLGTRMIAFAEERIAEVAPTVFLCVSSFNHRARALYERLGYEKVGELPDYIMAGHSEFLMWKRAMPLNDFLTASAGQSAGVGNGTEATGGTATGAGVAGGAG